MAEEHISLRRVAYAVRRHLSATVAVAALGIATGLLVGILQGPSFTARATVLVPARPGESESSQSPEARRQAQILTQAEILKSAVVVTPAAARLKLPTDAASLRERIDVVTLSDNVLELRVRGVTAREALELANAVVDEYIEYARASVSEEASLTISALNERARELDQQIQQLNSRIAAYSAGVPTAVPVTAEGVSPAIDLLRADQIAASRELSLIQTRIAEARLQADLTRRGTQVLGVLAPSNLSYVRQLVSPVVVGGTMGLAAGLALALLLHARDHRLRYRDDIARAVGAPVVASLAVPPAKRRRACRRIRHRWRPSVAESAALSHAVTDLGLVDDEPPVNLVLLTFAKDWAAASVGLALAVFLSSGGASVAYVAASRDRTLRRLSAAVNVDDERSPASDFSAHEHTGDFDGEGPHRDAEVTVTALVASDNLELAIPTWDRRTVVALAVSAGFATDDQFASATLAAENAGQRVRGVFVANPIAYDRTTGRIPNHLSRFTVPLVLGPIERIPAPARREAGSVNGSGGGDSAHDLEARDS
ncbi:MAG: Wzz/FepE/Etk N-terminal domain-containing protein [Actinomycetota bacterium]|nr:Wzz/FepE/Etk N-terminal domain-containing protein [Actinomycetota bacterium]